MIPEEILKQWRRWPYKNTGLLVLSLILFFYFAQSAFVQNIIIEVGSWGYLGSFLTGVCFVSIFTVAPASVVLFYIANILNPIWVAVTAGAGAVLGDYLIFRFLRDRVFKELTPVFSQMGGSFLKKLFKSPYFTWFIPLAGAFIIASPLPDEIGISMMSLSKIKNWHFILISFLLNAVGIFIIITIAQAL